MAAIKRVTAQLSRRQAPNFADVYREYFAYVWRVLSRWGVRAPEIEDAVQEVFLVVHRRLADFDPSRPIRPWLSGIAHRVALAESRRTQRRNEDLGEVPEEATDLNPEQAVLVREQFRRVRTALDRLHMEQRVVLVLADMEGMSGPEVAEALGVTLNTVYSRLRRGRQRIRTELRRLGRAEGAL
jgi:RNA polymerase sigma-70 factor (ECF subfamily)